MRRFTSGGFYHLGLLIVCATAFNIAFSHLTQINIAERLFAGVSIPANYVAVAICVSAAVVLWHNWVD